AFGAGRGVDALDPQGAERALLVATVAVGVLTGAIHRGLGGADGVLAAAVEALGLLQDFLVLGVGRNAPSDASHCDFSLREVPTARPAGPRCLRDLVQILCGWEIVSACADQS